ncbi:peptidylprolyl isomerase, FKBP-type family protein [Panicum miliaceum]|uniref:peptidylprolyl isomerase n=1 Tax=Panicum miliaceum TaxID=4540 RepID=A0A3L6RTL5_PANMI|nr:peptidylprolyl isomerase, FKBP-type family protein [Panicum miliaceum]
MVTTAVTAVAGAVPPPSKGKAVTVVATPPPTFTRRHLLVAGAIASALCTAAASAATPKFAEIPGSGGVKALDLREGSGEVPADGDQVAIHYYGRLAAKQGWRFDSTYDHKNETGDAMPFVFTIGSGKVIPGIEAAVKSMRVGGLRRVIIPPSQGYQNTSREPIPPNFFDRQRLFTTIFNPTRLANGEGSTLGTLIFDIELINIRQRSELFCFLRTED